MSNNEIVSYMNRMGLNFLQVWTFKQYTVFDIEKLSEEQGIVKYVLRRSHNDIIILSLSGEHIPGLSIHSFDEHEFYLNEHQVRKNFNIRLEAIKKQFKKILKKQGYKSRKKHPHLYF